jgi:hypothetical protein
MPPGSNRRGSARTPLRRLALAPALTASLVVTLSVGTASGAVAARRGRGAAAASRRTTAAWTVYHGSPTGRGVAPAAPATGRVRRAWISGPLAGEIYGEPLVATGDVIVATERDRVIALTARTGRVRWSTSLGTPVPAGDLPCGDIAPTVGVTGTPVIDVARQEVFVVADELVGGRPSHHLVGLSTKTGTVRSDLVVDPPGSDPAALLQRTGLALDRGDVVFGFGGNDGDCGEYRGWVVAAPEDGQAAGVRRYESDAAPGERQGAVWMGGAAPEVTADGDIWVAVGNGSVDRDGAGYDGSDSVVELDPGLRRVQLFAPADWYADNGSDLDLGSTAPALLADGEVVQAGKSGTAYLLRAGALGGIGGQAATTAVCDGGAADGGDAVRGATVYLPCRSGLQAVTAGHASLTVRWTADAPAVGPPIVALGSVWSVGDDTLYGLRPGSGRVSQRLGIGSNANHFPTPSFGAGLLLVTGGERGDRVLAFGGPTSAHRSGSPTGSS